MVARVHDPEAARHNAHYHQGKIGLAGNQREELGRVDLSQLGIVAGDHGCASWHSLIDYRHLSDDPANSDGLIDRAAAHYPQGATLDDVKSISIVALAEEKLSSSEGDGFISS